MKKVMAPKQYIDTLETMLKEAWEEVKRSKKNNKALSDENLLLKEA
jgi:hypothetical protein